MIGSKSHSHIIVIVRVRVMVMVRVKVMFRVRVSCFLTSTPHLYAIQSQLRPRLISGDWFQEPRPPPTLRASPSKTLVVLIVVLMVIMRCVVSQC